MDLSERMADHHSACAIRTGTSSHAFSSFEQAISMECKVERERQREQALDRFSQAINSPSLR